jgi:hypothetical protein
VSPKLALSNLPERNPFFTGRDDVLAQLQEALAERGRAALSGLGGVGKCSTVLLVNEMKTNRWFVKYETIRQVWRTDEPDRVPGIRQALTPL